ncbi:MAG: SEC-C metal-binding domain-containing protein [Thermoleophilia bacterium]
MKPPLPCIERLADGVGCADYAEPGTSRCADHAHLGPKTRSRGTTAAWARARKAALERDGWRCTVCGLTQDQAKAEGRGLEVHHVNASHARAGRSLDRDEHPLEELVTVCHEHHRQTMRRKTRPTWADRRRELDARAQARREAGGHKLAVVVDADVADAGEGQEVRAHVERQVRAEVGDQVEACERLAEFVTSRCSPWPGRELDEKRADPIIAAEFARARKSYAAVLHLVLGGFGPQAAMLNRALFEGTAVAHWAHANPQRAWELFRKHERHNELLWGDVLTGVGWVEPDEMDAGTKEERAELDDLFGTYGHRVWTGHKNLREVVKEIEHLWPEGGAREDLWAYFRVSHRDNNQHLHSSVTALMGGTRTEGNAVAFDSVPSSAHLDRALIGGLWCYSQTVTLIWDHFELDGRHELDALMAELKMPFITVDPALAKQVGRNGPCPCGSGRKYKRCHGA